MRSRFGLSRFSSVVVAAALVGCLSLVLAASAGAATTTIGQTTGATTCGSFGYSEAETSTGAAPAYAVPAGDGLITSWSTLASSDTNDVVQLRVYRATSTPGEYLVVADSAPEALTPSVVNTFPTHVVVEPGDVIGINIVAGTGPNCDIPTSNSGDVMTQFNPDTTAPGGTETGTETFTSYRADMSATVGPLTSTAVACSPSSVTAGKPSSCTATVTTNGSGSPPTGTVSFSDNAGGAFNPASRSCTLGAASGSSSSCSVSYTPLTSGLSEITAVFSGQAEGQQDTSSATTGVTVTKRSSRTAIACAPLPVPRGKATSCTATAIDSDSGTAIRPTGTMTFATGSPGTFSQPSCTLPASGSDSCHVRYTPSRTGSAHLTAFYSGDGAHVASAGSESAKVTGRFTGVSLHGRTLTVKNGIARVNVSSQLAARGKLKLTGIGKGGKAITLGSAPFSIAAGHRKVVKLHLSRYALKLLKNDNRLKATLSVIATDLFGTRVTTKHKVTLKPAPKKNHKQ